MGAKEKVKDCFNLLVFNISNGNVFVFGEKWLVEANRSACASGGNLTEKTFLPGIAFHELSVRKSKTEKIY